MAEALISLIVNNCLEKADIFLIYDALGYGCIIVVY